ncbi:MAG TPA: type II secretion system protein [Desulfitobacteriaceae bacterium]|nr:type II secretion system protein [Desulfitobacteriaceae bacterium]
MERNRRTQSGLTLIEVIVSLAVFGLIIVPLSAFFANSFKYANLAKGQMDANQLAQKYMEEYKSKSFTDLMNIITDEGGTVDESDSNGIDTYNTEIKITSDITSNPADAPAYDAEFTIPSDGGTLTADANGITVSGVGFKGGFTLAEPIKVRLRQEEDPSADITVNLLNETDYTLQVTKFAKDKLILKPEQGRIVIITRDGEETPESRYQEAGVTITVTVTPETRSGQPPVKPTVLSQIKQIR